MNLFNNNYCHSVKNKYNINLQCQNKCKQNEIFCGIHLNSNNVILYNDSHNVVTHNNDINNVVTYDDIPNVVTHNDKHNVVTHNDKHNVVTHNDKHNVETHNVETELNDKLIHSKDELFEIISNNLYISIYTIRKSIKNCDLKLLIDTKQSKQILIKSLKDLLIKERYYISNINSIILIQSFFRKWLVYRKTKCCNDNDILTFTCKYEIQDKYFYVFNDKINNKNYAYDIRTLYQIINSEYQSCPYTFRPFTDEEKNIITEYRNKLNKYGIDVEIPKITLTPEEEINMKIKDVFYQINMLDNYTNPCWFKNLELYQLVELYIRTEDIWNYRSNMDIESKKNIVNNGAVFNIPLHMIKMSKSKIKMQNIILNDYMRLITEGINREEKKLGAILILTALVEVSIDAADALPYLIQI